MNLPREGDGVRPGLDWRAGEKLFFSSVADDDDDDGIDDDGLWCWLNLHSLEVSLCYRYVWSSRLQTSRQTRAWLSISTQQSVPAVRLARVSHLPKQRGHRACLSIPSFSERRTEGN